MTFLPVVERELRASARRSATFRFRVLFALVAAVVVGVVLVFEPLLAPRSTMGGGLFRLLVGLAFFASISAGVFLTADAISEEKREGTLGLLFLSDLRGYDVVLGKLTARSLWAGYGLLAGLPVLSLTLLLGGVTAGEYWRMVLVLGNTLWFSLAAGVLVSTLSRDESRAMAGTILLLVGVTASGVGFGSGGAWWTAWTSWRLGFDAAYQGQAGRFWESLVGVHALSWGFLLTAAFVLPRVWHEGLSAGSWWERLAVRRTARRRSTGGERAAALERNPVAWLAARQGFRPGHFLWGILLVLAVVVFWAWVRGSRWTAGTGVALLWLMPFCLRLCVALEAGRFFADGRRSGSLELLLCTPLSAAEIARGQWRALREKFGRLTVVVVVIQTFPVLAMYGDLLAGSRNLWSSLGDLLFQWAYLAFVIGTLLADLLAVSWLGMWIGASRVRPAWVPAYTVLLGVLLPYVAFCFPRLLIDIPLFLWAKSRIEVRLRKLAEPADRPRRGGLEVSSPAARPPVLR